jgi:hypothetical protein
MAPISKVVYGSDGYGLPEINYVGARLGKAALGQALGDLVEAGMLSPDEARESVTYGLKARVAMKVGV